MKRKYVFVLLVVSACHHPGKKAGADQLQRLGSILPAVANWQVVDGTDTSYTYFSRQLDHTYNTIQYKLKNGDSSIFNDARIIVSGDSVLWNWNNWSLWLEEVKDREANWKNHHFGEKYTLRKINDSTWEMSQPGTSPIIFRRTLPMSVFLVRAKFDYEHHTSLADSAEIKPKKEKPVIPK